MSSLTTVLNSAIGIGTLISHIFLVVLVVMVIFEPRVRDRVWLFVHRYILEIIAVISWVALLGSLAYSQIIGFPPCELCWIQRIFIYPQAVISLMAIFRKDKSVVSYLLPLSLIGGLVALYQSFIQWGFSSVSVLGCTSAATGECAKIFVNAFGYITIPFMSFTIFLYAIGVTLIYYQARKIHG